MRVWLARGRSQFHGARRRLPRTEPRDGGGMRHLPRPALSAGTPITPPRGEAADHVRIAAARRPDPLAGGRDPRLALASRLESVGRPCPPWWIPQGRPSLPRALPVLGRTSTRSSGSPLGEGAQIAVVRAGCRTRGAQRSRCWRRTFGPTRSRDATEDDGIVVRPEWATAVQSGRPEGRWDWCGSRGDGQDRTTAESADEGLRIRQEVFGPAPKDARRHLEEPPPGGELP